MIAGGALLTLGLMVSQAHAAPSARARSKAPAPSIKTPEFIIGVYRQPLDLLLPGANHTSWQSLGINTAVGYSPEGFSAGPYAVSRNQWMNSAAGAGFFYMTEPTVVCGNKTPLVPTADDIRDANDPHFLAWMQIDEPNGKDSHSVCGTSSNDGKGMPALALQALYQRLKKTGNKAVLLNMAGDHVGSPYVGVPDSEYAKWADWLSTDWYPTNRGTPFNIIGQVTDQMRKASGGKRSLAFIETSNQNLCDPTNSYDGCAQSFTSRAPTRAELRGEIWESIIHGATGIIYFPQDIGHFRGNGTVMGSFNYDATTPENYQEMKIQNGILSWLGPILAAPGAQMTPGGFGSFGVAYRIYQGHKYYILINLSPSWQRFRWADVPGAQYNTFAPFAAAVYMDNQKTPIMKSNDPL